MAIKRISDLSSILCVGTSNSSGAISCLTIQQGVERDILNKNENGSTIENEEDNDKDNDKETFKLKEALFEVSWPFGEAPSGYTNFESRSISYWALSGYITHNILHETYTFAGNKKFADSISVDGNLNVSGNVWLGDSTDSDTGDYINIKGKSLSAIVADVYNEYGTVTTQLSGKLTTRSSADIDISSNNNLFVNVSSISIQTNESNETGSLAIRGYNTNISASNNIDLLTQGTIISSHSTDSNNGTIFISGHNIGITFTDSFTICCGTKPVLTMLKGSTVENPTVAFNKSTQFNPIDGYINHALWS